MYILFRFSRFEIVALSENCTVGIYLLNLQNHNEIETRCRRLLEFYYWFFFVFQMLCTTPGMAGVRSRDQLLSLPCNASQLKYRLGHDLVRLVDKTAPDSRYTRADVWVETRTETTWPRIRRGDWRRQKAREMTIAEWPETKVEGQSAIGNYV